MSYRDVRWVNTGDGPPLRPLVKGAILALLILFLVASWTAAVYAVVYWVVR